MRKIISCLCRFLCGRGFFEGDDYGDDRDEPDKDKDQTVKDKNDLMRAIHMFFKWYIYICTLLISI